MDADECSCFNQEIGCVCDAVQMYFWCGHVETLLFGLDVSPFDDQLEQ